MLSGGKKINALLSQIAEKAKGELQVGFFENETYPDGTSVAEVAFKNEFGDPINHIPPRPFFRTMIATEKAGWGSVLSASLKSSQYDGQKSLSTLGLVVSEQLSDSIRTWTTPGNAAYTIAKKGFDKPLVDTGQMMNAPEFKVSK